MEVIRQGDVLLVPIADRDPTWRGVTRRTGLVVRREKPGIVLAHGEATGHHHHVKERTAVMRRHAHVTRGRVTVLHVPKRGAKLEHQEHSAIALAPGRYEVRRQAEYVPPVRERSSTTTRSQFEQRRWVAD